MSFISWAKKKKTLCSKSAYQIPQGYFWHRNTNGILMSVISILYGLINFSIKCNKKSKYKPKNNSNYHISLDWNMCTWKGHNSLIFDEVFFLRNKTNKMCAYLYRQGIIFKRSGLWIYGGEKCSSSVRQMEPRRTGEGYRLRSKVWEPGKLLVCAHFCKVANSKPRKSQGVTVSLKEKEDRCPSSAINLEEFLLFLSFLFYFF